MNATRLGGAAVSLGGGALLALSLPPWGLWPLAFVGIVAVERAVADQPARTRFGRGVLVGFGLIGPTMSWLKDLTLPGYIVAVVLYSVIVGAALAACPPGAGRWIALPGVWILQEALRGAWPFGGVPLSTLAVGQVGGPLTPLARVGGTLLIGAATVVAGLGLAGLVRRRWWPGVGALAGVAVVVALAAVAPSGSPTGRALTVAVVQGGGPQGTSAIDSDPRVVVERHLKASTRVPAGVDLTLWPEDVVDVERTVTATKEGRELAALARRLRTTLVVGVIEDEGKTRFHNASVGFGPDGRVVDRYEKVQRVPFGEWVPFRSLIEGVAPASLPERDAVGGNGPATLSTPAGELGVVISWEVFFGRRARAAVDDGASVLLNPTNGSSFTGTFVQTQQVASSRLRAIETGRWVVQAAPTGFSGFITPDGRVLERTGVSERAVRVHDVGLRRGRTIYTRTGDLPLVVAGALAVGWGLSQARGLGRLRPRSPRAP